MKEVNKKRKLALKKARDLRVRKKELRKDIANFLFGVQTAIIKNPLEQWNDMLKNGFKGFNRMNSRELIKAFEKQHMLLLDKKKPIQFYALCTKTGKDNSYRFDYYRYGEAEPYPEDLNQEQRVELILESDALMSRLMEVIFDLGE